MLVFSVTAARHSKARSVADVPRRPVIAPLALPRPSRSDRSVAPRANSPAASREPKQNRTWYAPPARTTTPRRPWGGDASDDDPAWRRRVFARTRARHASPPEPGPYPPAALTSRLPSTPSALRRAVVARKNQSQPFESFPPFAIIVGAITAMGGVQYLVHHAYEGKPKPVGADNFDRLLKYRDIRLKDEAKVRFRRRRREADEEFIHQKVFSFFFFALLRGAAEPNVPRSRRFV